MIPLEVNDLETVGGLIEVLSTFPPEMKVLLNQKARIISVDGRGDVLWICDVDHSPLGWIMKVSECDHS